LPALVATEAAAKITLVLRHTNMYPVRQFGVMRGYRCFVARGYLFYYSVSSDQVRISLFSLVG
jgi:hypothetical protein